MAKRMNDAALTEDGDVYIALGDFVVEESTAEHQRQLLLNNKGDFKQNPTITVGAVMYLDDERFQELIRSISIAFSGDGMEVAHVKLTPDGTINTDAYYA